MDFDDQIRRYFGSGDIGAIEPAALTAGIDRMLVDIGLEQDPGRKFALWALLHMLGDAPDPDIVFEDRATRDAARRLMELGDADLATD